MACVMASGYGGADMRATLAGEPSPELQARAEEKREFVRNMVGELEKAIRNSGGMEEKRYLSQIVNPENPCFKTLINLMILPKYAGFVALRCVVLRAIQMILKVASNMTHPGTRKTVAGRGDDNVGMKVLRELAGPELAGQGLQEIYLMVDCSEQALVACDAMLVLAELGPEAFNGPDGSRVVRLLDLFAALPDRASDLVEVALRVHAWGGATRSALLEAAVTHDGGRYLGEVLLQMVNRGEPFRRVRAVKIYTGCFLLPDGTDFLYTNDKRVLVEILLRELPLHNSADSVEHFVSYADCYKELVSRCDMTREHCHKEAVQVFSDLAESELGPPEVRAKCTEVLALLQPSR